MSTMDVTMDDDEGYDIPHPLWDSQNREKTFGEWSLSYINIGSLAHAGFIYVGPGDKVKCVFCYLMVDGWRLGDDPFNKHVQLKPDCPHIEYLLKETAASNIPESERNIVRQAPAQPEYQYLDVRKKTFRNWPSGHPISPDDLAKSGFFYKQEGDRVQCFYCNLLAERWDPLDDPDVEHSRLNPKCPYMYLQKGEKFIQQCNPGATATEPSSDPSDQFLSASSVAIMRETLTFQGFSSIYIDCAFLQQKIKKEAPFTNSESLFNAIIKLPRAEEAASARLKDPEKTNSAEIALMKTCKICLSNEWKFISLPCKHYTCCEKCQTDFNKCPICNIFVNYISIDVDDIEKNFKILDL